MGADESFCSQPVQQLQIPTSLEGGLQENLKIYKNHIPSRNYARRSTERPNLSQRVQQTIKYLLQSNQALIEAEPLKAQNLSGHEFPCFLIFKKKVFYIGQWQDGLPHGKGRVYFPNGCYFQGWFNQGEAQGQDNIFIYTDGSFYRGSFNHSKKNGFGRFFFHNGFEYSGFWQNGKPHADQAVQVYPDGSKYIGGFVHGVKEGKGQYFWPDGKVYFGQFKNGHMHGRGTLKKGKQSYFQGHFQINKKSGTSLLKLPFGLYQGSFVDGLMSGEGIFRWNDGRLYKGNFQNGKMHGEGTITFNNGKIIVGEWYEGENVDIHSIKVSRNNKP